MGLCAEQNSDADTRVHLFWQNKRTKNKRRRKKNYVAIACTQNMYASVDKNKIGK